MFHYNMNSIVNAETYFISAQYFGNEVKTHYPYEHKLCNKLIRYAKIMFVSKVSMLQCRGEVRRLRRVFFFDHIINPKLENCRILYTSALIG